ncbi:MAG: hypothetical protein HY577_00545 [Candidatus Nealsonbacteria bacterium]|nr:hypothetical protein [Candidatus Nealsonbacteria bacterium]
MEKKTLILVVVVLGLGLALVSAAAYAGYFLGQKSVVGGSSIPPNVLPFKLLKAVNGVAFGKITAISGRILTLEEGGETAQIVISEAATVGKFVPPEPDENLPIKQSLKFDNLKIGDWAQVFVTIAQNKKMEGSDVTIMPAPLGPPPGSNNSPLPETSPIFSAKPVPEK